MRTNNPNIKQYAFKKGNQIGKLGKGVLKRKTLIKNIIEKIIEENRKDDINSIYDYEILLQKIIFGLKSCNIKKSSDIAIKLLERKFPNKRKYDLAKNAQNILVVERPSNEILKKMNLNYQ